MVHVWKAYTDIEEVDHQSSFTNCIIFYLWKKLEHIHSYSHEAMKSSGLPSIATISFLLLQYEAKAAWYGDRKCRVAKKDYLDFLNILVEVGEEEDNQLFQWVRLLHLDDEIGNPDPQIVAYAWEFSVDVDRVLSEKLHSESFSKDTDDSFETTLNSHHSIDSISVGQSSRPSVIGTSAFGYDDSRYGTDDGCDNVGGDVGQQQQSQYPMSPFTCEDDLTRCT